jgi:hypothetical protein
MNMFMSIRTFTLMYRHMYMYMSMGMGIGKDLGTGILGVYVDVTTMFMLHHAHDGH